MVTGNLTWNADAALRGLQARSGEILLRMAVLTQTHFMQRLNKSNPRPYTTPSVDGEFLRKRTGWLQAHIVYEPTSPSDVAREGRVRVGYGQSAFYGALWEVKKKRKGLLDAVDELKDRLAALSRA